MVKMVNLCHMYFTRVFKNFLLLKELYLQKQAVGLSLLL